MSLLLHLHCKTVLSNLLFSPSNSQQATDTSISFYCYDFASFALFLNKGWCKDHRVLHPFWGVSDPTPAVPMGNELHPPAGSWDSLRGLYPWAKGRHWNPPLPGNLPCVGRVVTPLAIFPHLWSLLGLHTFFWAKALQGGVWEHHQALHDPQYPHILGFNSASMSSQPNQLPPGMAEHGYIPSSCDCAFGRTWTMPTNLSSKTLYKLCFNNVLFGGGWIS